MPIRSDFELDLSAALEQIDSLKTSIESALDDAASGFGASLATAVDAIQGTTVSVEADVGLNAEALGSEVTSAIESADATVTPGVDAEALGAEVGAAIESVDATPGVDAAALGAEVGAAIESVDATVTPGVNAEALGSEVTSAIESIDVPAIDVPMNLDTGDSTEQVDALGGAFDRTGQEAAKAGEGGLATFASGAEVLGVGADLAAARAEALGRAAESTGLAAAGPLVAGISAGAAAFAGFLSEGRQNVAAHERLVLVFGEEAEKVKQINVGGLAGDLEHLATQAGSSGVALDQSVAKIGQMGIAAGRSAPQAADVAQGIAAIALRATAMNPQLGTAATVTDQLSRFLAIGGGRLARYGIDLSSAEVRLRAMKIAHDDGRTAITQFDKVAAGEQITIEKLGSSLGGDFQKGIQQTAVQFKALTETIKESLGAIGEPLVAPILDLFRSLTPAAVSIGKIIGEALQGILPLVTPVISALADITTKVATGLAPAFASLKAPLGDLGRAFGDLVEAVGPGVVSLVDLLVPAIQAAAPVIRLFADGVGILATLLDSVPGPALAAAAAIGILGTTTLAAGGAAGVGGFATALAGLETILTGVGAAATGPVALIVGAVTALGVAFKGTERLAQTFPGASFPGLDLFGIHLGDTGSKAKDFDAEIKAIQEAVFGSLQSFDDLASHIDGSAAALANFVNLHLGDTFKDAKVGLAAAGVSIAEVTDAIQGGEGPTAALVQRLHDLADEGGSSSKELLEASFAVRNLGRDYEIAAGKGLDFLVATGKITQEQRDSLTAHRDNGDALEAGIRLAERHAQAVEADAVETAKSSGAFVELREKVLAGSVTLADAADVADQYKLDVKDVTAFIKDLNTQLDQFVTSITAKLPTAEEAASKFAQNIRGAEVKLFTTTADTSGVDAAKKRVDDAHAKLAAAEREGGKNQASAIKSAQAAVVEASSGLADAERQHADDVKRAQDALVAALDPKEFENAITAQIKAIVDFQRNIDILVRNNLEGLAKVILEQGPEVGGKMADIFAHNLPEAVKSDKLIAKLHTTRDDFTKDVHDNLGPVMVGSVVTLANGVTVKFGENFDLHGRINSEIDLAKAALKRLDTEIAHPVSAAQDLDARVAKADLEQKLGRLGEINLALKSAAGAARASLQLEKASLEQQLRDQLGTGPAAGPTGAAGDEGKKATEEFAKQFDPATAAKTAFEKVPAAITDGGTGARLAASVLGSGIADAVGSGATEGFAFSIDTAFAHLSGAIVRAGVGPRTAAAVAGSGVANAFADGITTNIEGAVSGAFAHVSGAVVRGGLGPRTASFVAGRGTANAFVGGLEANLAVGIPDAFAQGAGQVVRGGVRTRAAGLVVGSSTANAFGAGLTNGLTSAIQVAFAFGEGELLGSGEGMRQIGFLVGGQTADAIGAGLGGGLGNAIPAAFRDLSPRMFAAGLHVGESADLGLAIGIDANAGVAIEAALRLAKRVTDILHSATGARSPSEVTKGIGRFLVQGLAEGLSDQVEISRAVSRASSMADQVTNAIRSRVAVGTVSTGLESLSTQAVDASASFKANLTLAHTVDEEIGKVRTSLAKAESVLSTSGGRVAEKLQVAVAEVKRASGSTLPTTVVTQQQQSTFTAPPQPATTTPPTDATALGTRVRQAGRELLIENHFHEKVDPLHVAAEIAWKLG